MSEPNWTTKPAPQLAQPDVRHEAVIDGLEVTIEERPSVTGGYARPWVRGWLADISIHATVGNGYDTSVEQARAQAAAAAHRLYAAGVRGTRSFAVSCCDRLFATQDGAEQHQEEHARELAVATVERDAAVDAEAMLDAYPAAFQGRIWCFAIASGVSACGKDYEAITEVIDNVTCPACLEWIARREAEASESGEEA